MPLILVIENEDRFIQRILDTLSTEGWETRQVGSPEAGVQVGAAQAPDLVLINSELEGAEVIYSSFTRRHGGPGVVAMIPEHRAAEITADRLGVDGLLIKPFTDQDLRLEVRRGLSGSAPPSLGSPAAASQKLTSEDIFGDLVAELESEITQRPAAKPAAPPAATPPSPTPPSPAPPTPAAAAPTAAPSRPAPTPPPASGDSDIEKKLEQTLSGVLDLSPRRPPSPPKAKAKPKSESDIDSLLSNTLSGLEKSPPKAKAKPEKDLLADLGLDDLDLGARKTPAAAPSLETPAFETPAFDLEPVADEAAPGTTAADSATPDSAAPATGSPDPGARDSGPHDFFLGDDSEGGLVGSPTVRLDSELIDALTAEPPQTAPPAEEGETAQEAADAPPPFGQYSLLERIAVGGMAEVWKARMKGVEGFQKTVAIKKILPHLTHNEDFVTMFIDEAKLAAQLSHPNIIHIYDLGKINSHYYIAMEYVDGMNLREILNTSRDRGLPMDQGLALLVGARLASALDYAHRKRDFEGRELGLVHRDVSPQNVLVSHDGDIKLCDFGIAKAVAKASHTQMGALKGKIQYMSPEQAWGRTVDPRSDIFSLGTLVYEMLTGRKLFSGDSEISVLEAVRECQVQPPKEIHPEINSDANRVLMTALAKEPDDRFQSASQLRDALEQVLYSLQPTPGPADLATYVERLRSAPETPPEEADDAPPFGLSAAAESAPMDAPSEAPRPEPASFEPTASAPSPEPTPPLPSAAAPSFEPSAPGAPSSTAQSRAAADVKAVADDFLANLEKTPGSSSAAGTSAKASPQAPETASGTQSKAPTAEASIAAAAESVIAPQAPVEDSDLEEGGGRRRWPLVLLIALLIAAGIAAFLYFRSASPSEPPPVVQPEPPIPSQPADPLAPSAGEVLEGATPGEEEEILDGEGGDAPQAGEGDAATAAAAPDSAAGDDTTQQISDLVDQELAKRERELRARLEAEQRRLQEQLEAAQRAASEIESGADEPAAGEGANEAAAGEAADPPAPAPTGSRAAPAPRQAAESVAAAPESPPVEEESPPATGSPPQREPPPTQAATPAASRQPTPTPTPQEDPRESAVEGPAVRRGEMVRPGPEVVPPKLVSIQKPQYPPIARRMGVQGDVVLSVLVDENGKVIDTRLTQGIERNVGINEAAVEAARSAKYQPATKDGVEVRMWTTLRLPFRL